MSNPVIAGAAGAVACAAIIGAGSVLMTKANDSFVSAVNKLSGDATQIADKISEKLGTPPKVEVNVSDIRMPTAEKAMSDSFGAITELTQEMRELSETVRGWSDLAWAAGTLLAVSGATYGLVIWPRQVVRDYIKRTLPQEDAFLDDDPPRIAMALLEAQRLNTSLGVYSPLDALCSELTFRRPGEKTRLGALSYAILYKSEEDALWLLRHGVKPDFSGGNMYTLIRTRMYGVLSFYLHHISEIAAEAGYYEADRLLNERLPGSNESLLSTLLEVDEGYEWRDTDMDVLTQLLELGASMGPVERQGRAVSLETIVNEKLARSPAKRDVLDTLAYYRAARAQAEAEAEAEAEAAAAAAAVTAAAEEAAGEGYAGHDASFVADSHEFAAEEAEGAEEEEEEEEGLPAPASHPPLQPSTSEPLKEKNTATTATPPRVRHASVHSGADTASTASGDRGATPKVTAKAHVAKTPAKAAAHVEEAPGRADEVGDSWETFEQDS